MSAEDSPGNEPGFLQRWSRRKQAVREGVMARANESQSQAMPADTFATLLVAQLARPDCPPVVRLGEKSRLLPWLKQWLPTRTLDRILMRRFQLDRLGR